MYITSTVAWFDVPKARKIIKFWFYCCFPTNRAHALDLYLVFMSRTHFEQSVGESIPQFLEVKVLNLQQWWTLRTTLLALTTNASLQNVGLTVPLIFLVHMWKYFDMLLCNLKWTKNTLKINFWKVTCLWHLWDRSSYKVLFHIHILMLVGKTSL